VAALEVLIDTPYVKDLIKKGEVDTLKEAMEGSTQEGGQTFDQALLQLYSDGHIGEEQALANADSANNLRIRIKNIDLARKPVKEKRGAFGADGLRIEGPAAGPHYRRM